MPKGLRRIHGGGDFNFITCSCYRRLPFLGSARRRGLFLKILEEVRQRYSFIVVGFVVMPEPFHILMSEPKTGTLFPGDAGAEATCLAEVPGKTPGAPGFAVPLSLTTREGAPSFLRSGLFGFELRRKGGIEMSCPSHSWDYNEAPCRRDCAGFKVAETFTSSCSCYRRLQFLGSVRRRDLFLKVLGRGQAEIQDRRSRLGGHAGALSYPDERTEDRHCFPGDAGAEATCGEEVPGKTQIDKPDASLEGGIWSSVLADAVLRLQRLQRQEEDPEVTLHASQPGEAEAGNSSGAVAMEQLSLLSFWGRGRGEGRKVKTPTLCFRAGLRKSGASSCVRKGWGTLGVVSLSVIDVL
jgi:hypothetical protein